MYLFYLHIWLKNVKIILNIDTMILKFYKL